MRYTKLMSMVITTAALLASVATAGAQDKGKKKGGFQLPPMIHISIADFADGGRVPNKYTCAASPTSPSPAMTWSGAPATTQSYVVILHDPDPVLGGSAEHVLTGFGSFKGELQVVLPGETHRAEQLQAVPEYQRLTFPRCCLRHRRR